MYRILIADSLGQAGIDLLRESGAQVDLLTDEDRPRLNDNIGQYDALIVRSATQVTRELLAAAKKMKVVGRAGVGVDNIDIKAATAAGVLVINAPTSNLLSATEHTFALMLAVARQVSAADSAMKAGTWDRKTYVGQELEGKTLGVIGFGKIGQGVATRAQAFNMKVIASDPFLNADVARQLDVEAVELEEMLERSDVITFHTPLTDQTRGMLNAERIALMKDGAMVINCGRGGVIDEAALLEALEAGKLLGAGLDVWSKEPPDDFTLAKHPRVVATPHLGASTVEAQERVATDTAEAILKALSGSLAVSALNLPFRAAGSRGEPYLMLGDQLGRLASAVLDGPLEQLQVELWGVEESLRVPITIAALKGALVPFLGEAVNFVNAEQQAKDRGVEVVRSTHSEETQFTHLVRVTAKGPDASIAVAGTLFGEGDVRVVEFQGFQLEFRPAGRLLVVRNNDVPGVVGRLGTLIGDAGINIAAIHLSRQGSEEALAVLRLDQQPSAELVAKIEALDEVKATAVIDMEE
jgi:D-3-phosphoglycerate dehydrogenase